MQKIKSHKLRLLSLNCQANRALCAAGEITGNSSRTKVKMVLSKNNGLGPNVSSNQNRSDNNGNSTTIAASFFFACALCMISMIKIPWNLVRISVVYILYTFITTLYSSTTMYTTTICSIYYIRPASLHLNEPKVVYTT